VDDGSNAKRGAQGAAFVCFVVILPVPFRDGPKDQTRKFDLPGSMLRIAPE
jgi:hypothetical protein